MQEHSPVCPEACAGAVAVITVAEGPEVQMEVAFLAGALGRHGALPHRVAIDSCTDEDGYQARLRELAPRLIVLPYAREFREMLLHLAVLAHRSTAVPVVLAGDGLEREEEPPELPEGVGLAPGDFGAALSQWFPGTSDSRLRPESVPADYSFFGGEELLANPMGSSLFGEMGAVGLLAARGCREDLSPTALLARLEAPLAAGPLPLLPEVALAPLDELGARVRRVEWWDRDASEAVHSLLPLVAARGARQAARVLPLGHPSMRLEVLARAGVDRVVFEVDRLQDAEPMPGSAATAEDLRPWVEAARRLGLEVGILLVVGVPGESRAAGRRRTELLRSLRPDHLRCVTFEPTGGHPAYQLVHSRGWWPPEGDPWLREILRPLRQPGLPADDFMENWADALDLLAEVECGRPA